MDHGRPRRGSSGPDDAARRAHLSRFVRARAEDRPGVYRMLDADGELLYVGKSVRVRTRLLSYFRAARGEKAAELIRSARKIRWEYVANEFWALVRELRLIKRHRPPYNVEHAGRTRYAFVKLTREPAPRLVPTTRAVDDGSICFGPFPRPARLTETVRELAHALGLRDCAADTPIHFGDQLEIFSGGRTPRCLRAETGSCLAPCAGRCTEGDYAGRVRLARRFLEGRSRLPVDRLKEAMRQAGRRMDFEYASILRDRAERMERFQEQLVAFRGTVEDLTFVYRVPGFKGDDRLYLLDKGRIRREMPYPKSREARARTARVVEEVYGEGDPGPAGLAPEEAAEILLVARWFGRRPTERRRTLSPERWLERRRPA